MVKKEYFIFLIFFMGCFVKILPELIAYPFPIGYDVINYYIPSIIQFEKEFDIEKFQLYLILLYAINTTFSLSEKDTVIILSSICYGFLSVIFFLWSRRLGLSKIEGLFMTVFVIFQISMLRTSWDLHKDILALVIMFTLFYIITYRKHSSLIQLFFISSLTLVILLIDIMISFLTFISLIIFFTIYKKWILLSTIMGIALTFFIIILIFNSSYYNPIMSNIITIYDKKNIEDTNYNQINMFWLFIKINILIIPTFIIGLRCLKSSILYISTTLVLIGSMSWIIVPNTNLLLPDRWIILSGIFISIFSIFGLISLIHNIRKLSNTIIFSVIFSFFVIAGLSYMVMPNENPFPIYAIYREYTDFFIPASMQFNSIDIKDNQDLLTVIEWINNNTQSNAKIYADNHLEGWMKIMLKDNRTFEAYHKKFIDGEGIYLIDETSLSSINKPVNIFFTKGNFNIIRFIQ